MGTIVVFENVSLDGVTQDPTGEEGFGGVDWRAAVTAADRDAWADLVLADALGADALLLGRGGYEFFAARYPGRTGALADRMNGLPKYVVSGTLTEPAWHDSTVLTGDVPASVRRLTETVAGEIRVYGSSRLVATLLEHDLVDELRLAVFPIVMGAGTRILDRTGVPASLRPKRLSLTNTRVVGDNLLHLTYRPDTAAT